MKHNYFALFNIPVQFKIDQQSLEKTYYKLSSELHPDRFVRASAQALIEAQEKSAELNLAYQTLKNKEQRLHYLLEISGHPFDNSNAKSSATHQDIPLELAEDFFELQELALEDPVQAAEKILNFKKHCQSLLDELLTTTLSVAEQIPWTSDDSKTNAAIQTIIANLKKQNYITSLIQNTEKLKRDSTL